MQQKKSPKAKLWGTVGLVAACSLKMQILANYFQYGIRGY